MERPKRPTEDADATEIQEYLDEFEGWSLEQAAEDLQSSE